jgi:ANTAR domain
LALSSGPCLDAIEECTAQIQTDLTTSSRWPSLVSRILAETPVGGALGAFAKVATNSVAHGEDAAALRRGFANSREIGKAIGMLMVLDDVSDDDAFGLLRRASQETNVKLVDVAAGIVRERGRPAAADGG